MNNTASRKSNAKLKQALQDMIDDDPNSIRASVATEALDEDDIPSFFHDLARGGCVNGQINSLVWYSDTHQFFDRHYDEIEEMREDWKDTIGEPVTIKGDLKNFFAWFAFEETAYQIANELELEI